MFNENQRFQPLKKKRKGRTLNAVFFSIHYLLRDRRIAASAMAVAAVAPIIIGVMFPPISIVS
jgi:hypothetical protein